MSRYFTEKINPKFLADKIWDTWVKHPEFEVTREEVEKNAGKKLSNLEIVVSIHTRIYFPLLTSQIKKDIYGKVEFDIENLSANPQEKGEVDEEKELGFHTLENGLTYLGAQGGGDWEEPVFFILYWDGKKLRGYAPKEGNIWNTDTKEAYGNDEDSDKKNIKKRGIKKNRRGYLLYDFNKIFDEIRERIVYRGK